MLGKNHVYGGMLTSFLLFSINNSAFIHRFGFLAYSSLNKVDVLTYVLIGGGAALIPDIDSESSYVSQSLGFVTVGIARFLDIVDRHRGVTHTVLFAVLIFCLYKFVPSFYLDRITVCYVTGLALYVNVFAVKRIRYLIGRMIVKLPIFVFLCLYGILFFSYAKVHLDPDEIALHIAGGVLSHIFLDMCTLGGCRFLWPFLKGNVALSGMRVGGVFEKKFITPVLLSSVIIALIVSL